MKYYRLAADAGNTEAQNMVGLIYDLGLGVPENNAEAVKWYRKAALNGDFCAQNNLGLMYKDGEGLLKIMRRLQSGFVKRRIRIMMKHIVT